MAYKGNFTDGIIRTSSTLASAGLLTPSFHLWAKNTLAPTTPPSAALASMLFAISDEADTYQFAFAWHQSSAGSRQAISHQNDSNVFTDTKLTTPLLANTLYGIGGSYDATNVKAYLNGANEATTAASAMDAGANVYISVLGKKHATFPFYDDSTVMELGVWNVALNAAEFAALGKRVSPLLIRPASLVVYWSLIRGIQANWGPAITSGGTVTVQGHSAFIYPSEPQILRYTATSGETPAIAKSVTVAAEVSETHGDVVTLADVEESITHAAEAGSTFAATLPSVPKSITHRVLAGSRFTAKTPYLRSGRRKERP